MADKTRFKLHRGTLYNAGGAFGNNAPQSGQQQHRPPQLVSPPSSANGAGGGGMPNMSIAPLQTNLPPPLHVPPPLVPYSMHTKPPPPPPPAPVPPPEPNLVVTPSSAYGPATREEATGQKTNPDDDAITSSAATSMSSGIISTSGTTTVSFSLSSAKSSHAPSFSILAAGSGQKPSALSSAGAGNALGNTGNNKAASAAHSSSTTTTPISAIKASIFEVDDDRPKLSGLPPPTANRRPTTTKESNEDHDDNAKEGGSRTDGIDSNKPDGATTTSAGGSIGNGPATFVKLAESVLSVDDKTRLEWPAFMATSTKTKPPLRWSVNPLKYDVDLAAAAAIAAAPSITNGIGEQKLSTDIDDGSVDKKSTGAGASDATSRVTSAPEVTGDGCVIKSVSSERAESERSTSGLIDPSQNVDHVYGLALVNALKNDRKEREQQLMEQANDPLLSHRHSNNHSHHNQAESVVSASRDRRGSYETDSRRYEGRRGGDHRSSRYRDSAGGGGGGRYRDRDRDYGRGNDDRRRRDSPRGTSHYHQSNGGRAPSREREPNRNGGGDGGWSDDEQQQHRQRQKQSAQGGSTALKRPGQSGWDTDDDAADPEATALVTPLAAGARSGSANANQHTMDDNAAMASLPSASPPSPSDHSDIDDVDAMDVVKPAAQIPPPRSTTRRNERVGGVRQRSDAGVGYSRSPSPYSSYSRDRSRYDGRSRGDGGPAVGDHDYPPSHSNHPRPHRSSASRRHTSRHSRSFSRSLSRSPASRYSSSGSSAFSGGYRRRGSRAYSRSRSPRSPRGGYSRRHRYSSRSPYYSRADDRLVTSAHSRPQDPHERLKRLQTSSTGASAGRDRRYPPVANPPNRHHHNQHRENRSTMSPASNRSTINDSQFIGPQQPPKQPQMRPQQSKDSMTSLEGMSDEQRERILAMRKAALRRLKEHKREEGLPVSDDSDIEQQQMQTHPLQSPTPNFASHQQQPQPGYGPAFPHPTQHPHSQQPHFVGGDINQHQQQFQQPPQHQQPIFSGHQQIPSQHPQPPSSSSGLIMNNYQHTNNMVQPQQPLAFQNDMNANSATPHHAMRHPSAVTTSQYCASPHQQQQQSLPPPISQQHFPQSVAQSMPSSSQYPHQPFSVANSGITSIAGRPPSQQHPVAPSPVAMNVVTQQPFQPQQQQPVSQIAVSTPGPIQPAINQTPQLQIMPPNSMAALQAAHQQQQQQALLVAAAQQQQQQQQQQQAAVAAAAQQRLLVASQSGGTQFIQTPQGIVALPGGGSAAGGFVLAAQPTPAPSVATVNPMMLALQQQQLQQQQLQQIQQLQAAAAQQQQAQQQMLLIPRAFRPSMPQ